jgi:hypothetical protein
VLGIIIPFELSSITSVGPQSIFAADRGKLIQELIKSFATIEILKEMADGYPCTRKDNCSNQLLGVKAYELR